MCAQFHLLFEVIEKISEKLHVWRTVDSNEVTERISKKLRVRNTCKETRRQLKQTVGTTE